MEFNYENCSKADEIASIDTYLINDYEWYQEISKNVKEYLKGDNKTEINLGIVKLHIASNYMGDIGMEIIGKELAQCCRFTILDLSKSLFNIEYNNITFLGIKALSQMIIKSITLRELILGNIKDIFLAKNMLEAKGAEELEICMSHNSSIKVLNLGRIFKKI